MSYKTMHRTRILHHRRSRKNLVVIANKGIQESARDANRAKDWAA